MTNQEIGRSLASSFVEMAAALDKLPAVEADLAEAQGRVQFLEQHNRDLGDNVIDLKAKIATLEANLDASTKSASGHKDNLALLLDEARKVMGQLGVAIDIVDPKPIEVVPQAVVGGDSEAVTDLPNPFHGAGFDGTAASTGTEGFEEAIVQPPFAPAASSTGQPPQRADGVSTIATGPTENPSTPSGEVQSSATPTYDVATPNFVRDLPLRQGDENPTDKPEPRPYWLKPSNMTWTEWAANNGYVPQWIGSDRMSETY